MKHEYTRQRQGRDFTNQDQAKQDEQNKSLLSRLDRFRAETERYATPIDGNEPPEKGR